MRWRGGTRAAVLAAVGAGLIVPATAPAAKSPTAAASGSAISVHVKAPPRAALLQKVDVVGQVANPTPTDKVQITVTRSGRPWFTKKVDPKPNGVFEMPLYVTACCLITVEAENAGHRASDSFGVRVPKKLGKGRVTKLYNRSLRAQGYHVGGISRRVTLGTRLATKAFRKVNGMGRSQRYRPAVFRKLLQGRGAFKPRYEDGRHVEVDLSRQAMALVKGGKARHTFHISSGAASTPTIRGKYRFYRREPGYNNVRMYYSVYFRGGYAIHGYSGVPNYPASHGCVRNPIPFSRFIYNWVEIGMPIYVYT